MKSFEWENKDGVFGNYVETVNYSSDAYETEEEKNARYIKKIEERLGKGWLRNVYEALL